MQQRMNLLSGFSALYIPPLSGSQGPHFHGTPLHQVPPHS